MVRIFQTFSFIPGVLCFSMARILRARRIRLSPLALVQVIFDSMGLEAVGYSLVSLDYSPQDYQRFFTTNSSRHFLISFVRYFLPYFTKDLFRRQKPLSFVLHFPALHFLLVYHARARQQHFMIRARCFYSRFLICCYCGCWFTEKAIANSGKKSLAHSNLMLLSVFLNYLKLDWR